MKQFDSFTEATQLTETFYMQVIHFRETKSSTEKLYSFKELFLTCLTRFNSYGVPFKVISFLM